MSDWRRRQSRLLRPLPRSFYDRNARQVAPDLVGCLLVRREGKKTRVGRIVETEAYIGEHDLACHARAGRTARTEVMYGEPGHAYVYLIYGVHPMLNAVCGPGSAANAVLIRAAEPVPGELPLLHSATGPGNLCKAFDIGLAMNRDDLCDPGAALFIAPRPAEGRKPRLWRGPRVGVDYSGEWASRKLRFLDRDSAHVSRPRPPQSRMSEGRGSVPRR
ncbi:MAG: DNA-3-methyladenine glycosylase [Deltaproteobacteria bacterium]|nr:MAG: DNA-3-methyladenine glycosylase [Deltaproteobacteria bacterium]